MLTEIDQATTEPTRAEGRTAVLILGMHRSGTSALSGVLAKLGCAIPATPIGAAAQNARGFFESWHVARLNDRILAACDSSWHDWRAVAPPGPETPEGAEFRRSAADLVTQEFGGAPFLVLKDPRICRLGALWLDALDLAGYRPAFLHSSRSPAEVAQSLRARNGFPLSFGRLLWLRHVLDAERLTRGRPRAFSSYDGLLANWRAAVSHIEDRAGLRLPVPLDEAGPKIDEFLSPGLRTAKEGSEEDAATPRVPDSGEACWRIFQRWSDIGEDPRDHEVLDRAHEALSEVEWTFVDPTEARDLKVDRLEARLEKLQAGRTAAEQSRKKLQSCLTDLEAAMRPIVGQDLDGPAPLGPAERVRRAQRALAAHGDRLEAELGRSRVRLRELEDDKGALAAKVSGLQADLARAEAAYGSARGDYEKILSSRAWRLTAPVRRLADRLKRR